MVQNSVSSTRPTPEVRGDSGPQDACRQQIVSLNYYLAQVFVRIYSWECANSVPWRPALLFTSTGTKALHGCSLILFDPFFLSLSAALSCPPFQIILRTLHRVFTFSISLNFLPGPASYCLAPSMVSPSLIQHLHLLSGLKDAEASLVLRGSQQGKQQPQQ